MSDHPEVPRVTLNDDGESLNIEEAVEAFRKMLLANVGRRWAGFAVKVEMRECDCDLDLSGRDDYCPLHGDPEVLRP